MLFSSGPLGRFAIGSYYTGHFDLNAGAVTDPAKDPGQRIYAFAGFPMHSAGLLTR